MGSHHGKTRVGCLTHSGGHQDEDSYRPTPSRYYQRVPVFQETPRGVSFRVGPV